MYICIYVYMYICIYVYTYICIYVCMYVCFCIYIYIYIGMPIRKCKIDRYIYIIMFLIWCRLGGHTRRCASHGHSATVQLSSWPRKPFGLPKPAPAPQAGSGAPVSRSAGGTSLAGAAATICRPRGGADGPGASRENHGVALPLRSGPPDLKRTALW